MTDLQQELASLRETVRTARSMPMSASAVVNRAELLEALERVEAAYAAASAESRTLVAHRDAVLAEGEQSASEILREARMERDRLASDTEVFRVAQHQAEELLVTARTEAEALRKDADAYVEGRLANFEHSLERTLTEVRRGISNLSGRNAFDAPRPSHLGPPEDVLLAEPEAG